MRFPDPAQAIALASEGVGDPPSAGREAGGKLEKPLFYRGVWPTVKLPIRDYAP